jgi:citrate synthase
MTSENQWHLVATLNTMHFRLAMRDNLSSTTVASMAQVGKPMCEAFAAALLTLGGAHAPISQTRRLIAPAQRLVEVDRRLAAGLKIPGFGSSFVKDAPDPEVEAVLLLLQPGLQKMIGNLSGYVQLMTGRLIFPNAAMATAAVASELGMLASEAPELLIQGRIPAWVDIYNRNFKDSLS